MVELWFFLVMAYLVDASSLTSAIDDVTNSGNGESIFWRIAKLWN